MYMCEGVHEIIVYMNSCKYGAHDRFLVTLNIGLNMD
jgi:hypothetical protein